MVALSLPVDGREGIGTEYFLGFHWDAEGICPLPSKDGTIQSVPALHLLYE